METEKIKQIPINGYLSGLGVHPTRLKNGNYFYRAFYRGGNNPESLKVDSRQNLWCDYVTGEGGSVIDLCMLVEKCNFHQACVRLAGNNSTVVIAPPAPQIEKERGINIVDVRDISSPSVRGYILKRGISVGVARKYCKEVGYMFRNGKRFFGLGFPLDSEGGWVLRSDLKAGGKYCTEGCISTLKIDGSKSIMIFEGFFDFLSYVELYGSPSVTAVVLNSVALIKRAYPLIEDAEKVYILIDNDTKGNEVTDDLRALFGAKIIDKRAHFAPYKDFNEYLLARREGSNERL